MMPRLIFVFAMVCVAAGCGGSAKHSVPWREAGVSASTTGGTTPTPEGGSIVASTAGGGTGGTQALVTAGAISAPPSSQAGSQTSGGGHSASAGITSTGGTATGGAGLGGTSTNGRSLLGGAGATMTGGTSLSGGVGGATTPVSSLSGGGATGGKQSTGGACAAGPPLTGGTQYCDQNGSGSYGHYTWKYWSNTKTGCLTTTRDGAFRVDWNLGNSGDLWAGVGLRFDGTKTHQELGTFSADFAESKTGTAGTASYIGVYGYSEDALCEFFISDDSFEPPLKPWNSKLMGTLAVDGGVYDIYKTSGSTAKGTFTTIHSIRQERRSCGHISISTHFSKWEEMGMTVGKLQEVEVLVETLGGNGSIDFTTVKVEVN